MLVSTVPVVQETTQGSTAELEFPQVVDGGGYTTQFVLIDSVSGQTPTGSVDFRTVGGQPLDLKVDSEDRNFNLSLANYKAR